MKYENDEEETDKHFHIMVVHLQGYSTRIGREYIVNQLNIQNAFGLRAFVYV